MKCGLLEAAKLALNGSILYACSALEIGPRIITVRHHPLGGQIIVPLTVSLRSKGMRRFLKTVVLRTSPTSNPRVC